ncbi:hypothetical protein [Peribacillus frigoritolerans]|uniref:hypothetical protein n=1 Tax=Peribacillus frigoritolerans TaxID=450367 RepID=UPI0030198C3D
MILESLELKIRKHVKETVLDERDDLAQELKIKIIEKADIMLDEDVPGFIEFVKALT